MNVYLQFSNILHLELLSLEIETIYFFLWSQEKPDMYDKMVREMALEMRARPSDRTKTPEEIAQEERERLEQLEVPGSFFCCLHV